MSGWIIAILSINGASSVPTVVSDETLGAIVLPSTIYPREKVNTARRKDDGGKKKTLKAPRTRLIMLPAEPTPFLCQRRMGVCNEDVWIFLFWW